MNCLGCAHWILARTTAYADGSMIDTFRAPEGKGRCESLNIDTAPDFGCTGYAEDGGHPHVITTHKVGAPWQHWKMGPCPDCSGKGNAGDGACHRCAGTHQVRYYEDGFIGEERTRLHPKEREVAPKPTCGGCKREIDIGWVACPFCGHKLEPVAAVEKVEDPLFAPPAS